MKTFTLAMITLVAACTGVSQAYAGTGNVLLGQPSFESRCESNGGTLDIASAAIGCDLGDILVSCEFAGAYAECAWNGAQMNRSVSRLIGAVTPQSIAGGGGSGGGDKQCVGMECNPNWGIPD